MTISRLPQFVATVPLHLPSLLLAAGLALAAVVDAQIGAENAATKRERFTFLAERVVDQLKERMQIYEYGVRSARGAIISAGGDQIRLAEFQRYMTSREHQREFPGSRGFGYISRVPASQTATFIERVRRDGRPDFDIHQIAAHDGERFVIQIIEPLEHNREAVGLDIASEPSRRRAAVAAMHSGQPTLTAPITLVQASGKRLRSFLLLLAVYQPPLTLDPRDAVQESATVVGWAYTPLVIDEVLADFDFRGGEFCLTLGDLDVSDQHETFYSSPGSTTPVIDTLIERHVIELYGRRWLIEIKALPAFVTNLNLRNPHHVAGLITLFSVLLSGLLWIYLDNTRKRLQAAESRSRLAAIIESTDDAIIGQGLDGRVVSWNPAAERLFGYRAAEMIGREPPVLDAKGEAEAWQAGLRQVRAGRTVRRFGIQHRHRDGSLIELATTISPVHDGARRIIGLSYIVRDLSDYHRLESQLRSTLSRMRLALDAARIGIWEWQLCDNRLTWDQSMFAIYGIEHARDEVDTLDYTFWLSRIHPLDRNYVEERLRRHLLGEELGELNFRIQRANGEVRHLHSAALIERDEHGRPQQMVGINRDVTDKFKAEQALIDANRQLELKVGQRTHELLSLNERLREAVRQAEGATKAKSDFLANMSHEIRTPINAVLGLAYLLEQTALDEEQHRLLTKIHSSGRALLTLINDILDFSKIEAGRLELEHTPFRLGEVLENIATIMAPETGDHRVELIVGVPPSGVDTLYGDALRLQQVLTNLVSNALKFTEQGQVVVRVGGDDLERDHPRLHFSVKDTGIGIAPDKLQAIFQAFTQADTSTTRRFGGSGLGLAICRRLVEAMGGTLGATSSVGQGSEFWFTLPYEPAPPLTQRPALPKLNVLVVDDNEAARTTLNACAKDLGWSTETAGSGEEALRILRERQHGPHPFDLLLIDWRMPEMDGIETVQRARDMLGAARMPRVIMATAYGLDPGLSARIDALIHKPITPSALYNAMQQLEQQVPSPDQATAPRPAPAPPAQEPRLKGLRLLVVDDSEINREVARSILEREGAKIHEASDGREAVEWVEQDPERVDLVLMDIQMPVMDGYMATHELRERLALPQLPVIALTAGAFQPQREAALAAGMNDFLSKPFDVDQMIATIRSHTGREPTNGQGIVPPSPSHHDTGAVPLLDLADAMTRWRDTKTYNSNLRRFAEQYTDLSQTLQRLTTTGETPAAAALAHKIKGAAANLGLKALQRVAAALETRLRAQQADETAAAIEALAHTLQSSQEAITAYLDQQPAPPPAPEFTATREEIEPLLSELLIALDQDEPALVRPLLERLQQRITAAQLSPIRACIEDFDFRAAEQATRRLAETLDMTLDG
ncbi:response regulator [Marichromatium bheemlicum]|uniref:histidine kinase n=1 Tax=Marichromatium bheemlicum TaxID=365339 RepID=A0ABX1IBC7_9GAMM|nr:response regulator [Marichromatium bheemlicum]NKN33507.1 response regulator [Marichromatium bheemlicum]